MPRSTIPLERREKTSLVVVLLVLLLLIGGLAKLQILQHRQLAMRSEENRIRVVPVVPRRGRVYDREGRPLIDNRPSYTVAVVPAEMQRGQTLPSLARLLDLDTLEIERRIARNMVNRYQPAPIKRDVGFEVVAILAEQMTRFPGVAWQTEHVRQYGGGLAAESYTGYVGEVSYQDLSREEGEELRLGSLVGKKGLEKQQDFLLRGREGTAYLEVTASGQVLGQLRERAEIPAEPGADITLSIDIDLQQLCAEVLDTFCCGAVVAMDPRNGEVLAMASYPGYDANIFSSVVPESLWQAMSGDSAHPLLNRPLNGLYPPASTVKLVTIGAALQEGLITANSTEKPCTGRYRFGNRVFGCWQPGGHGSLAAAQVLEQSCDVFIYQIGLKLGIDKLSEYYDRCGFGHPTGIDLPGESPGLNPDSRYYNRRYGKNRWTRGLVLNNAIGQGELLVTPVQLTQFFCGVANHGIVYVPHIVRTITYADGEELTIAPRVSFTLPFSDGTLSILLEGIRLVVEGDDGTARSLKNDSYSIGGKTGTAQNPHGENHSWFVGVAPLEEPEIVVCAIVENAGHGSEVAAPIVGRVIRCYMDKKLSRSELTVIGRENRQ
ncbi:MAG: penicillin-binding protein 2 [bacterium]